jgi:AcrR family transcriptional regulator
MQKSDRVCTDALVSALDLSSSCAPEPRKTRGKMTRDALVQTALRLIAQNGVAATSVLEITQYLGVSNGTFYYHFQNMEELLEVVGGLIVIRLGDHIEAEFRKDPAAQIARGPLTIVRYFVSRPDLQHIMLHVVDDPHGAHPELHANLKEDIIRGQRVGRFSVPDIDVMVGFCRAIIANGLRHALKTQEAEEIAFLAALHTLTLLGLPAWEASAVVEQERAAMDAEKTSPAPI